jgi:hypothetical protein
MRSLTCDMRTGSISGGSHSVECHFGMVRRCLSMDSCKCTSFANNRPTPLRTENLINQLR